MKHESSFLNRSEQDLIIEVHRYITLTKAKQLDLSPKQYAMWAKIKAKAIDHPTHDYAVGFPHDKDIFMGCHISTTAKRDYYRKKDLMPLSLE